MKDKKLKTKQLQDKYPSPEIPADEAWAAMNRMLGAVIQTPSLKGHPKFPVGNVLLLAAALVVVVVTIFIINHRNGGPVKTTVNTTAPNDAKTKNEALSKLDTGKEKKKESVALNDLHQIPALIENTRVLKQAVTSNTGLSYTDSIVDPGRKPVAVGTVNSNITPKATRKNNLAKDMENGIKNKQNGGFRSNRENVDAFSPGKKVHAGKSHGVHVEDRTSEGDRQTYHNVPNEADPFRNSYVNSIKQVKSLDVTGIATPLASLIATGAGKNIDSSFLGKLTDSLKDMASAKKRKRTSKSKEITLKRREITPKSKKKVSNVTAATGLGYGLQWGLPIPLQGTANYSKGTDGKSKQYNILLPQLWVSKDLNRRNKLFLTFNLNQQYFFNKEKIAERRMSSGPADTGITKIYLYKTDGVGGSVAWSYAINNKWAASIGMNFISNKAALLSKQGGNIYIGNSSDSLYGIRRSSIDWQYINKGRLTADAAFYYTFKKFDVGAVVSIPLSTTPVYGNKNIHPLNALIFVRWNIKKK